MWPAAADTIFDTYNYGLSNTGESLRAGGPLYQSFFTAPTTDYLNYAEFFFRAHPGDFLGDTYGYLLADNKGKPGAVIEPMGHTADYTFTDDGTPFSTVSVGLGIRHNATANTRYWIELAGFSYNSFEEWNTTLTPGLRSADEYWTDYSGVIHTATEGHGLFQMYVKDGRDAPPPPPPPVSASPEPSAIGLALVGFGLFGGWRRLHAQKKSPAFE